MAEDALFGEQGRRTEETQWGVRFPAHVGSVPPWSSVRGADGTVTIAADRGHAEAMAGQDYWGPEGRYRGQIVSRTVVTHTTAWEVQG